MTELTPDVVLMDIGLPDLSGLDATQEIKRRAPQVAVVALTIHEDEEYFFKMLQAGASGYVPKRAAPEELLTAIRTSVPYVINHVIKNWSAVGFTTPAARGTV